MENSDKIKRCVKEVENCVREIILSEIARAILNDCFSELVVKHMVLVHIQKAIYGFRTNLTNLRDNELIKLTELRKQTTKVGIAKVQIQRANDLRRSICDIASNLKSHLRSSLVGVCEAIDDVPGAQGGLKDRWNNILQPAAANEAKCSITDHLV